uniref:hypothetical protein n=1 Tax=Mycobacterium sp. UM_Kg1 TaxID=1545691 RepID=UPI000A5A418D
MRELDPETLTTVRRLLLADSGNGSEILDALNQSLMPPGSELKSMMDDFARDVVRESSKAGFKDLLGDSAKVSFKDLLGDSAKVSFKDLL